MRLLLLAGAPDSAQIAGALAREHRVAAIATLPRADRAPVPLGLPTRIGGWGGEDAFRDWLRRERVGAILDAAHPFAEGISDRAVRAATDLGIDYLRFQRPPWMPGTEDRWTFLNDCAEVGNRVPEGATILLDTGARGLSEMGALPGRTVHVRSGGTAAPPPGANGHWHLVPGQAPFDVDSEMRLYHRLRLDWIVLPNVGGSVDSPKLDAARRMGIRLGLIRRPRPLEAPRAETVSEVIRWVRRRL